MTQEWSAQTPFSICWEWQSTCGLIWVQRCFLISITKKHLHKSVYIMCEWGIHTFWSLLVLEHACIVLRCHVWPMEGHLSAYGGICFTNQNNDDLFAYSFSLLSWSIELSYDVLAFIITSLIFDSFMGTSKSWAWSHAAMESLTLRWVSSKTYDSPNHAVEPSNYPSR